MEKRALIFAIEGVLAPLPGLFPNLIGFPGACAPGYIPSGPPGLNGLLSDGPLGGNGMLSDGPLGRNGMLSDGPLGGNGMLSAGSFGRQRLVFRSGFRI